MANEEAAMVMCELVRVMVTAIVNEPDQVKISADTRNGERVLLNVIVAPVDVGKVIGKQGRTARSLRTILGAASMTSGVLSQLNIREGDDDDD